MKVNEKFLLIFFSLATVLILVGGVFLLSSSNSPQITKTQDAKVQTFEKKYDWGEIKYSGGNVEKTFKLKNSGKDTLKLFNIKTSCLCTKAIVKTKSEESPYFSMHTTLAWVGEVAPGEEASVTVIFDPAFHGPSGVGPISRQVTLETNDLNNPQVEFNLTGNVVK